MDLTNYRNRTVIVWSPTAVYIQKLQRTINRPMNLFTKLVIASLVFCCHQTMSLQAEESFRILLTNDDGIHAPGIRALAEELGSIYEVMVCAPSNNQSGSGSTSSLRPASRQDGTSAPSSVKLKPASLGDDCDGYAINGTPADAVRFGLRVFGGEQAIDLVVSGINGGENLGGRARSSGTIGAAFTGLAAGIPSLAISADQAVTNYTATAKLTAQLIQKIRSQGLPKNILLSVNVPAGDIEGIVAAPMAVSDRRRVPREEPTVSESGELTFTLPSRRGRRARNARANREAGEARPSRRGRRSRSPEPGDTDEYYFRTKNLVTITPLRLDWTDYEALSEVKIPAQRAGHWFGVYKTPGLSPQRGLSDSVVPTGSVIG